jgi:hypothetical protein
MPGILEEVCDVRTDGTGGLRSDWDDVLLKRDLAQLIEDGRVREIPHRVNERSIYADEREERWFLDCATGDTYQYTGHGEKSGCSFRKLTFDDLKTTLNTRPSPPAE